MDVYEETCFLAGIFWRRFGIIVQKSNNVEWRTLDFTRPVPPIPKTLTDGANDDMTDDASI